MTATVERPERTLRAVIYNDAGQVVLVVADLAELCAEAIKRGLVVVR